ncbi:bifunctional SulP family inorganic anion transporter/carbonic anhydrase [Kribbella sp. CA-293567]|uniref:bifunctional SulP family inorganic anion transporter/carbonic anhydrase n=1 Tax=Kribbella sp. CA-293567 TaxID=3002436 RepID=UPI0022DE5D2C|nr:bifunctional SulP family inorganic anion transporter/carbonic anhydrase [Kribbella sp. CA-293567]WBQ02926.1 bifunctional SulP family inorganic anion transporter/carbonic anhydrase [Kribbella sp. CA-293567]
MPSISPNHSPPTPEPAQPGNSWRTVVRHDVPASLVVFLIAIPLSLGIAAASGAPLIAGLVAAVVGGIVAGALGGSPLQVSGPAAGLTVVVAGLATQFGWAATAGITCAAGLLQILLGVTRIGRLALSLSPAVVHGMLAGIGVTIAVQQLHVVLGGQAQSSLIANLAGLPEQLMAHHPWSVLVGILTVVILLVWPRLPRVRIVPAPLVAVVAVTALAAAFMVDVTRVSLPDEPLKELIPPTLPGGGALAVATAVLTVALVASVESLLSAVAVDKLHRGKRSNLDRELIGQGAANAISGALGGMPVTGVIVRSSTNVAAGARSRASAILHGVWIAVFVLAAGAMLELIPMAALAGVLLVTGLRLVQLAHIRTLKRHDELIVYVVTAAGVAVLGLAEGVLAGLVLALARVLYRLAKATVTVTEENGEWIVRIRGTLVFLGVASLVRSLRTIPAGAPVRVDLRVNHLDHAAYEAIEDWRRGHLARGGSVVLNRSAFRAALRDDTERRIIPWQQGQVVPEVDQRAAMLDGIREFEASADPIRPMMARLAADGQQPTQLFITCADSRIVPNMITTTGPGDQFCVRNVGNLVPPYGSNSNSVDAAVEYAVEVLGVASIVVCGHSHCGAAGAALDEADLDQSLQNGSGLKSWLKHLEVSVRRSAAMPDIVDPVTGIKLSPADKLSVTNVAVQLENLRSFACVREAEEAGRLELVGLYFDIGAAAARLVLGREPYLIRADEELAATAPPPSDH